MLIGVYPEYFSVPTQIPCSSLSLSHPPWSPHRLPDVALRVNKVIPTRCFLTTWHQILLITRLNGALVVPSSSRCFIVLNLFHHPKKKRVVWLLGVERFLLHMDHMKRTHKPFSFCCWCWFWSWPKTTSLLNFYFFGTNFTKKMWAWGTGVVDPCQTQ